MITDCEVHNDLSSAELLLPYLDPAFKEFLIRGEHTKCCAS